MDDYDVPFDGMSEEEFEYRAMNEEDPMYMGDSAYVWEDSADRASYDEYWEKVEDWTNAQLGKIADAIDNYMADPDDDPKHYFDDIEYDPYPER